MPLYTRSIQKKKSIKDGIRICIMRKITPDLSFDIWLPVISPSERLRSSFVHNEITWNIFYPAFKKEMTKKKRFLELLIDISKTKTVTLLCWEKSALHCHRSIVAELITEIDPTIKVVHR